MRAKVIVVLIVVSVSISICFTQTLDPQKKIIKLDSYLPNDHQVEQGIYLKQIGPFCIDNQNNLYLGDINYCTFHKFDELGQLLFSFGEKGQGPQEFMQVHRIAPFQNGLILMDSVNKRIQILDENGTYQSSLKIFKSYTSMAASDENLIFVSPRNTEDHLIDVLDTKGQLLRSFGEKIETKNPHNAFNQVILSTNLKREVWATWYYFPYIIRYSK
ncbi:MAG: 6-bladed beta-propeller [Candidatus Aminicenantes bacterium]|nr:6-bladed beta-propeller [Candidatus Aminicenantes bacterium]